jgi:molecular chaperone GrpE
MENENDRLVMPLPENAGQTSESDPKDDAAPESPSTAMNPADPTAVEASSLEKLKEERAELYERLLRKQAELDNFRKRAQQEKESYRQYATEDLIRTLLPVLDGFERALKQRSPAVPEPFYEGMELIHRQLLDVLARAGVEAIEATGQLFDPHYHQAVETVEDATHRDQEILEELQRGYKLKHRLLRPAIVKVAVEPKGPHSSEKRVKPF